jgi:hypothetical protein
LGARPHPAHVLAHPPAATGELRKIDATAWGFVLFSDSPAQPWARLPLHPRPRTQPHSRERDPEHFHLIISTLGAFLILLTASRRFFAGVAISRRFPVGEIRRSSAFRSKKPG